MLLGKGTYAKVWLKEGTTDVAVKRYKKTKVGIPSDMLREVSVLKRCRHPSIIRILRVKTSCYGIELPRYPISLGKYLRDESLSIAQIKKYFNSLCRGVYYLHSHGILHGDIKPANILLSDVAVLIDPGFARTLEVEREYDTLSTRIASLWYRAPEIFLEESFSFEIDVWSLGCVLAEMIFGEPLLRCEDEKELLELILDVLGTPKDSLENEWMPTIPRRKRNEEIFSYVSDFDSGLYRGFEGFLCMDPRQRLSLAGYLNDSKKSHPDGPNGGILNDSKKSHPDGPNESINSKIKETRENYKELLCSHVPSRVDYPKFVDDIRRSLCIWCITLDDSFDCPRQIYFKCIDLFDRYMMKKNIKEISRSKLAFVTCYWIAVKIVTYHTLPLSELVDFCDYSETDYVLQEEDICRTLDYNLSGIDLSSYIPFYFIWKKEDLVEKEEKEIQEKEYVKLLYIVTLYPNFYEHPFILIAYAIYLKVTNTGCAFLEEHGKDYTDKQIADAQNYVEKVSSQYQDSSSLDWKFL